MRFLPSTGLILTMVACGGASQTPPAAAPAPSPASQASRSGAVTFSAGTTRFRLVSHAHQEQQIEGNTQTLNFLLEYLITVALTPDANGRLRMTLAIDSIRSEGGFINPVELSRAKGARLTGVLNADGQITELTGDSLLSGQLQTIATAARQFFPRLPPGGAEPGKQWSDTTDVKTSGSPQLSFHFLNDRRIGEWTQYAGTRVLPIDITSRYTITGSGQQMGQDFTLDGTGLRLTNLHLSADGRYLGATARDSSNVTVTLTRVGISFPSVQVRADTVSTIP